MFLEHLLAFPFLHIACSQILLHLPKYKIKKKTNSLSKYICGGKRPGSSYLCICWIKGPIQGL